MSTLEVKISEEDLSYLRRVAGQEKCSPEHAAEIIVHRALKAQRDWEYLRERARRGRNVSWERFSEILAKAPDVPPIPGDELPEGWNDGLNKH
jgi:hypothetical protein